MQVSSVIIAGVVRNKGRGLFIQKKNAFSTEKRGWPAHSRLCLHVCGAECSILLQDTALLLHQKTLFILASCPGGFRRVSVRDSRRLRVPAVALEMTCVEPGVRGVFLPCMLQESEPESYWSGHRVPPISSPAHTRMSLATRAFTKSECKLRDSRYLYGLFTAVSLLLEGRGSVHCSSHFLPSWHISSLFWQTRDLRGCHPAAALSSRTRCEMCLVTEWTRFLFNPLQMMRCTDICQVPFPHISSASTSFHLSFGIWV